MRAFFIKRELRRMSRKLDEIVQSDTNALLTTDTADKDIAMLTIKINAMLESNRRGLREKDRAEAALKRAITNISHDLRTPLTSALGYLQMMESDGYIPVIRERLESLSVLMNSLFEFANVIEGNTVLNIQKVNISSSLRDALSDAYAELEAAAFTVDVDIPDEPVFCLCDKDALRRVLQNLLKNVCVHGRETLRVRLTDDAIEIANKADDIDILDTERIFDRFYTADASRTSQNTGLGLAIAKELITRMNGRIVANINERYLCVRVSLPNA
jgi:signal transduction histidine kinase